jgi:hypothetical protein
MTGTLTGKRCRDCGLWRLQGEMYGIGRCSGVGKAGAIPLSVTSPVPGMDPGNIFGDVDADSCGCFEMPETPEVRR